VVASCSCAGAGVQNEATRKPADGFSLRSHVGLLETQREAKAISEERLLTYSDRRPIGVPTHEFLAPRGPTGEAPRPSTTSWPRQAAADAGAVAPGHRALPIGSLTYRGAGRSGGHRIGEIECVFYPLFGIPRWSKVDDKAPGGEVEARVSNRGPHSLARLLDSAVCQTGDRVGGQTHFPVSPPPTSPEGELERVRPSPQLKDWCRGRASQSQPVLRFPRDIVGMRTFTAPARCEVAHEASPRVPNDSDMFHHSHLPGSVPRQVECIQLQPVRKSRRLSLAFRGIVAIALLLGAAPKPISAAAAMGSANGGVATIAISYHAQIYNEDCEEAALQMALSHEGLSPSQQSILSLEGVDSAVRGIGPRYTSGNPMANFIGLPWGLPTASSEPGAYYGAVAAAASREGGQVIAAGEGISPSALYLDIEQGHPAVVWVTFDFRHYNAVALHGHGTSWPWAGAHEHAVTIRGVNLTNHSVLIDNPWNKRGFGGAYMGVNWVPMSLFQRAYSTYWNMAVVLQ
jgi:uncharacterized protein YvpB